MGESVRAVDINTNSEDGGNEGNVGRQENGRRRRWRASREENSSPLSHLTNKVRVIKQQCLIMITEVH